MVQYVPPVVVDATAADGIIKQALDAAAAAAAYRDLAQQQASAATDAASAADTAAAAAGQSAAAAQQAAQTAAADAAAAVAPAVAAAVKDQVHADALLVQSMAETVGRAVTTTLAYGAPSAAAAPTVAALGAGHHLSAVPLARNGRLTKVRIQVSVPGTYYFRPHTRVGNTYTRRASIQLVCPVAGLNELTLNEIVLAGDYLGVLMKDVAGAAGATWPNGMLVGTVASAFDVAGPTTPAAAALVSWEITYDGALEAVEGRVGNLETAAAQPKTIATIDGLQAALTALDQRGTRFYTSRADAVEFAAGLPTIVRRIQVMEAGKLVIRARANNTDDPLFGQEPYWGISAVIDPAASSSNFITIPSDSDADLSVPTTDGTLVISDTSILTAKRNRSIDMAAAGTRLSYLHDGFGGDLDLLDDDMGGVFIGTLHPGQRAELVSTGSNWRLMSITDLAPRQAFDGIFVAQKFGYGGTVTAAPTLSDVTPAAVTTEQARQFAADYAAADGETRKNVFYPLADAYARDGVKRRMAAACGDRWFEERVVAFWTDHFTTVSGRQFNAMREAMIEDAIRQNINGSFGELLESAEIHPMMMLYLDQDTSAGDGSYVATRPNATIGLNENLGRELLELHTVGVTGSYTQADVRAAANILAGIRFTAVKGRWWESTWQCPTPQTVMGVTYSSPGFARLQSLLANLAVHPETAAHIGWKLAVHFVSDNPPQALIDKLRDVWLETNGLLPAVYGVLLNHSATMQAGHTKVRQPVEWMTACLRAVGMTEQEVLSIPGADFLSMVIRPTAGMGMPESGPIGPDGWAEAAEAWIQPQIIPNRLSWARNTLPAILSAVGKQMPNPEAVMAAAFQGAPPAQVALWAPLAQDTPMYIAAILASAEFQRR